MKRMHRAVFFGALVSLLSLGAAQTQTAAAAPCDGVLSMAITDFAPGMAEVSEQSALLLGALADSLSDQNCKLRITGYASVDGTSKTNNALSAARAMAVLNHLRDEGVPGTHLHFFNVGETDEFGRLEANRRVSVVPDADAGYVCSQDQAFEMPLPEVTIADYQAYSLDLSDEAKALLAQAASAYKTKSCAFFLTGYASSDGHAGKNKERSGERGQIVKDYLVSQGVEPGRLTVVAFGETDQFGNTLTSNRRVMVQMK